MKETKPERLCQSSWVIKREAETKVELGPLTPYDIDKKWGQSPRT